MMLGEILGRRAGETGMELMLPRFLLPRGRSCGVFLAPNPAPARSCGLCVADGVGGGFTRDGDGGGTRAGVLEPLLSWACCVGAGALVEAAVLCKKPADSGSSKVSMWSVSITSWLPALVPTLWEFGELSFMSEAGVAGDASPGRGG